MDAAGQLAQLGDGRPGLLGRGFEQRLQIGIGARGPVPGDADRQRERDEPLLRAVVQVAFQPAALGVAGLHDPGAGGADLVELDLDLGLQPGVLQGQAGRGRGDPDQLRLVPELGVVDEDGLAGRVQRGDHPPGGQAGQVHRGTVGVR